MKVGRHTSRGSSGSTWRVGALAACIVLMAVALAGCGWVTFRYNPAHTGYNATEKTIGLGNVASLTRAVERDDRRRSELLPRVFNPTLFVGSTDGKLHVYDAAGATNCSRRPEDV